MKFRLVFFALLFVVLSACGKKTDPVPLDTFKIPVPVVESIISLTEKGVTFNNNSNYSLLIEKADIVDDCVQDFKRVAVVKQKSLFDDTNVKKGEGYVYKLYNIDENLEIASKEAVKKIVYNQPVRVKNIKESIMSEKYLHLEIDFSDEIGYYEIYLNSKLLKKSKQNSVDVVFEDRDTNLIEIVPFDKYFNKGTIFRKNYISYSKFRLDDIKNIKVIKRESDYIVSWDSVTGASGYIVYIIEENEKRKLFEVVENFAIIPSKDICKIAVSAFNSYVENNAVEITLCGK